MTNSTSSPKVPRKIRFMTIWEKQPTQGVLSIYILQGTPIKVVRVKLLLKEKRPIPTNPKWSSSKSRVSSSGSAVLLWSNPKRRSLDRWLLSEGATKRIAITGLLAESRLLLKAVPWTSRSPRIKMWQRSVLVLTSTSRETNVSV